MGFRDNSVKRKVSIWNENNALLMLITLNVFVFITLRFIMAVYGLSQVSEAKFYSNIFQWFAMPGDFMTFVTRPWTLISAAFTQLDLFLLISNMLWLWTYGFIFQDLTGNRSIFPLYLYGALTGAVFFLVSYALFPASGVAAVASPFYFGATAPIIAIAIGATFFAPGYRLFPMIGGGIPLWVLTLVFAIIDVFYLRAHSLWFFSHLGAAVAGIVYVRALKNGRDWGNWMYALHEWVVNLFNPKKTLAKRRPLKQEVFYNTGGQKPFKKRSNLTQQRIDEILDKINQRGYDKLTDEEKELLRRASEEDL